MIRLTTGEGWGCLLDTGNIVVVKLSCVITKEVLKNIADTPSVVIPAVLTKEVDSIKEVRVWMAIEIFLKLSRK